jgi:predicted amidohydrolase YtcJ
MLAACAVVAQDRPAPHVPTPVTRSSADWVILDAELVGAPTPGLTALAIVQDHIAAVGHSADMQPWIGPHTRVVRAQGRSLIPGLIDSHIHAIRAGLTEHTEVQWSGVRHLHEALNRLQEQAHHSAPDSWIVVAGGWTPEQFVEQRGPTPHELEHVAPGRAVYVQRGYTGVILSSEGMRRLAQSAPADIIARLTAERDGQGQETGWLLGDARTISNVYEQLPRPSRQQQVQGTLAWLQRLSAWGITGVIDPGGYNLPPSAYRPIQQVWREGRLTVRVNFSVSAPARGQELPDFQALTALVPMGWGDGVLRFNGIGENVTWGMYNNEAPSATDQAALLSVLQWAAQHGYGATFHWNNNDTVHLLLDVLDRVNQDQPIAPLRWSIAHLNNASVPTLERMRQLGVGWLVQNASHFQREGMRQKLGAAALSRVPPLGDALRLGVPIGMGTDAHRVMDPNPFVCLQWLVDGLSVNGLPTRSAEHLLDRDTALRLYTQGSAWFSHDEHRRGRLDVGMLADLALLSDSYLRTPVDRIHQLGSQLTWLGGRAVHAAGPYVQYHPGP